MVLLIMLLHAVPVFIIGVWLDDVFALAVLAFISGLVGIFTGSPEWIAADLFGVAIAYYLGKAVIDG